VIPGVLRAAPIAAVGMLVIWTAADLFAVSDGRSASLLFELLVAGAIVLVVAGVLRRTWLRPIGLTMVVAAYLLAHALFLGVQVLPALAFLVILIGHVELRILAERFARLYEVALTPQERSRIRRALGRAALRLCIAAVLAVVVPVIAANLAVAGVVTVTTIPSAILLAGALIFVIVLLAILPSLRQRTA